MEELRPVAPSWRHTPAEPSSGQSPAPGRAQLRAELMDPFIAHSPLSPSIILIPEGPQKNRWSRGVKRGCESVIKAEQWLPRARSSRSLTVCLVHAHVPSWFKARAEISARQPASLPAIPTSTSTASRPKAVLAPSFLIPLEKESQHTWGAGGDAVHFPHGFGSAIA